MATKKTASSTAVATTKRAQVALPADIEAQMAADIAAFQGRMSAPSGNRISVTQDRKFRDAAGEKHDTISGVIVNFAAKKAWYEGAYDKDNIVPPNCFALGFVPHDALEASENSPDRQWEDGCKTCPKNAFKSAANGKGKACGDSYRLALLSPDSDAENAQLTILELSATAIKPFEKYVRALAKNYGKAPYCFITEFFMDDSVDYASVRCGNPEPADAGLLKLAFSLRDDAEKMLAQEPDVADFDEKVRNAGKSSLQSPKKGAAAKPARR